MKRAAASPSTRTRTRKKTAAPAPDATAHEALAESTPTPTGADARNVGSLESGISTAAGILFVVAALFPRSLRQLLLLGIGGGLVYRGVTGQCSVYSALGIDTAKEPLLKQINEKYLAPAIKESAKS